MNAELYIKRCLELAEKANGHTAPNPMVGAVLVHESRIIGEGWHRRYGEAHAEVNCIGDVAPADRSLISESTLYVSLEPCSHHGKTPPCAERIIREGIKKVVICNDDPFEKVAGNGIALLESHGIEVSRSVLDAEGKWLNRRFFTFHERRRPYIILKWAQTRSGFFAPADRSRLQLTNKHSTQLVHKWRTEEAAIMVGFNTALHDNPQLTSRYYAGRQPLRIVLDKQLKLPASHHVYNGDAQTWLFNETKTGDADNIRFIQAVFDEQLLSHIMAELHSQNIQSVIIEGGARLLQDFIQQQFWDEARVFTAAVDLKDALPAPALTNARHILSTDILTDTLDVYVHQGSPYSYKDGMNL